ncbi:DgyrCDS8383 [Dimorphilus gyrociliatus]|uniref:Histone deacetylase 11 n=1 Tax=Dimorphilus gyrociliatus TaxID=2664684 RepID=A0A7I8VW70_9ANNE|nr:DgyrCDS8383 [Dimorphilus gyrociliatus]
MPGLDECSLFSLEIVIDKLKLSNLKCLFPTVAFRLLDFPTLLIKHVEDSLDKQIKAKIKRDTTYKIPNQFSELKNKDGYFVFSKGKSTLFKVSLNELLHHLNNTPLYIMIMDSFADKPRLVANCLIPLDVTMNNLYLEIKKNGLSVPCVKSLKGTFKIYNLMGSEIGEIHLAYRISSLGFTLMAHLPEKTIHKVEMPIVKENLEKVNISIPTKGAQEELLQRIREDKERFTQTDTEIPEIKEQSTQIEDFVPRMDAFVQTEMRKKRYGSKRTENIIENEADHESHLIVPNILCPPPLFYNSELEKTPKFDHSLPSGCIPAWCESETESIREEDRYSDVDSKEFDEMLIRHKAKVRKDEDKRVTVVKSYPGEKVVVMDKSENESLKKFFNRFPMLNELVRELTSLSKLQGSKEGKTESPFTAQPEKRDSRQSFIDRLSTPKKSVSIHDVVQAKSFRRPCKEIVEEKKKVRVKPSEKESVQKKKRTGKPEYGMTHTQRLRLAERNPKLLEALECEERKRLLQFQSTYKKTIPIEPKLGKERFKLPAERNDIPTPRPRKSSTMSDISFRKPIPTPRQSIIHKIDTSELAEEYRIKLERESSSSYMTATSDPYSHTETFLPTQEDSKEREFANGQNEEEYYYTDEGDFSGEEEEEYHYKGDKADFGATRIIKPAISFEPNLDDTESVREYSPRRNVIRNSDDDDRTRLTDKTQKSLEPLKSSISPEVQDDKTERTLPPTRAVVGNTPTPSESRTPSPRLAKYQGGSVESSVEESSEYRPKSPRRPRISRLESVHTESVSSYCPSDDEMSDLDDESLALNIKPISELRPSDQAKKKLGYTWGKTLHDLSSRDLQMAEETKNRINNSQILKILKNVGPHQWPIVFSPEYNISFFGMEKVHPFDAGKWGRIFDFLKEASMLSNDDIVQPCEASESDLLVYRQLANVLFNEVDRENIVRLEHKYLFDKVVEIPPVALVPNFIVQRKVMKPLRYQTAGTILAAQLAIKRGWAINIGGGFHHCSHDKGGGFCAYADITLAIRFLQSTFPDHCKRILIVDLDAHQGNGHERDFLSEGECVKILDVYNRNIYPFDGYAKRGISWKVELPSYTKDDTYLNIIDKYVKIALNKFQPNFILYNAGTDVLTGDPLGCLDITADGIISRDQIVFTEARKENIPILMVTSGGYQRSTATIIAESILNLRKLNLIGLSGEETPRHDENIQAQLGNENAPLTV